MTLFHMFALLVVINHYSGPCLAMACISSITMKLLEQCLEGKREFILRFDL